MAQRNLASGGLALRRLGRQRYRQGKIDFDSISIMTARHTAQAGRS